MSYIARLSQFECLRWVHERGFQRTGATSAVPLKADVGSRRNIRRGRGTDLFGRYRHHAGGGCVLSHAEVRGLAHSHLVSKEGINCQVGLFPNARLWLCSRLCPSGEHMESSADRDSYWMLAEVAIWIRTRDINHVLAVDDPTTLLASADESKRTLEELPKRCRSGHVRSVGRRCIWPDSAFKLSRDFGERLQWMTAASRPSDVAESIPTHEWADLDWEPPVDGKVTGNLRSKSLGRRAWMTVQFSQSDVMREWPSSAKAQRTHLRQADKRRGPKPIKLERVKQAMMRDMSQGQYSSIDLQTMLEKHLAAAGLRTPCSPRTDTHDQSAWSGSHQRVPLSAA